MVAQFCYLHVNESLIIDLMYEMRLIISAIILGQHGSRHFTTSVCFNPDEFIIVSSGKDTHLDLYIELIIVS